MTEKSKGPSIAESQAARDAAIQKEEARWDPPGGRRSRTPFLSVGLVTPPLVSFPPS